ncbi:MAG TPA: OmpA family protein [Kofleriaceae bacterium]|nr:OmpA family protein [Kofleriaceae bacterium]
MAVASTSACSKNKKAQPVTTAQPTSDPNAGKKEQKPAPDLTKDQQVSPGLAISGDIVALCNLKIEKTAAQPKFDYDKDELTEPDRKVLDQIAACMTTGPLKGKTVSLIGRADPRGTEEYNMGLGSRRAQSVSQYLGRLGVGQPQLAVTTRGALDAKGSDEAGWKEDRRVDIQLATPEG